MSVDLIIAGDLHASEQTPECRTDNYLDALCAKIKWMTDLQKKYKCPIVLPGDLFDKWLVTSELFNRLLEVWPTGHVLAVPGQHDLPQHSIEQQYRCGYETLVRMRKIVDLSKGDCWVQANHAIYGLAWGQEPFVPQHTNSILVWHTTTWMDPIKPGDQKGHATRLLAKHKGYDLIITGDNHQTFTTTCEKRLLVNAGSVMRKRADQIDFKPCVFLWDSKTNTIKQQFIPIIKDAVSRKKIEQQKAREERENVFVSRLNSTDEVSLSFDENVQCALKGKSKAVREMVLECVGE